MRNLLTLILLGLFSVAMVGCEASGEVGDPDNDIDTDSDTTTIKKTTVHESDGDKTVTKEVDRD